MSGCLGMALHADLVRAGTTSSIRGGSCACISFAIGVVIARSGVTAGRVLTKSPRQLVLPNRPLAALLLSGGGGR